MKKQIRYFLNGESVTKDVIAKRKAKLDGTVTVVKKYYKAPFTAEEIEKNRKRGLSESKYFSDIRENREDMEKFH